MNERMNQCQLCEKELLLLFWYVQSMSLLRPGKLPTSGACSSYHSVYRWTLFITKATLYKFSMTFCLSLAQHSSKAIHTCM